MQIVAFPCKSLLFKKLMDSGGRTVAYYSGLGCAWTLIRGRALIRAWTLIRGIVTDGIIFLLKIFHFISIVTTKNRSDKKDNDNNSSNNNLLYPFQEINVNLRVIIYCYREIPRCLGTQLSP